MDAYIVAGFRSAVGKAPRGLFRFTRPDDLADAETEHRTGTLGRYDVDGPAHTRQQPDPARPIRCR